jgi:hypothetical protein
MAVQSLQKFGKIVYASRIPPRPIGGSRSGNRHVGISEACDSGIPEARNPGTAWSEMAMEWNRMEWNGTARNGMEWNGMVWSEMEWNGMEWNGVHGMEWNEIVCSNLMLDPPK